MLEEPAAALEVFRSFDYERIYLRAESRRQANGVIRVLTRLVDRLIAEPWRVPAQDASGTSRGEVPDAGSTEAARRAVAWVAGMTDRYALARAGELDGGPSDSPAGPFFAS